MEKKTHFIWYFSWHPGFALAVEPQKTNTCLVNFKKKFVGNNYVRNFDPVNK